MDKLTKNKWRSVGVISIFTVTFLLWGWMKIGLAQENAIDLTALIQETQRTPQRAGEITVVWWIPEEYWQVSFAQNRSITESQAEEFIKIISPYMLIVVVEGKIGMFGGVTYKSEADIRSTIQIKDRQGVSYLPLNEDEIDPEAKNLLSAMKPTFANMLGPVGENMHFFLFPAKDKEGRTIAEAGKEGSFSVILGERELRWRLPLSSVLPPKVCPTCKEKLSGAYKFCPWDGTELSKKSEQEPS